MKKEPLDYLVTAVLLFVGAAVWLADAVYARQLISGAVGVACLGAGFVALSYYRRRKAQQDDGDKRD